MRRHVNASVCEGVSTGRVGVCVRAARGVCLSCRKGRALARESRTMGRVIDIRDCVGVGIRGEGEGERGRLALGACMCGQAQGAFHLGRGLMDCVGVWACVRACMWGRLDAWACG